MLTPTQAITARVILVATTSLRALLITRGGLFLFAWIALVLSHVALQPGQWSAFPYAPAIDGWVRWDSGWYWTIADHGYVVVPGEPSNVNFFPLYPLLAWLVSLPLRIGLTDAHAFFVAGILISQVAFAFAVVGLERLGRDLVGAVAARRAVWLFCLFPFSLFFSAVYTESLFVALAIWAFIAARRGQWWIASGLASLCAVTRIPGFAVGLGIGVQYLHVRKWRIDRGALALLCMPLPIAIYMAYLWRRFGDPVLFIHTQTGWGRSFGVRHFIAGWNAVRRGGEAAYAAGWYLALVAVATALVVPVWRRFGPGIGCFVATSLLLTAGTGLDGTGRYISILFPLFLLGGAVLARTVFVATCAVFAANLAYFTYAFTHWRFVT